MRQGAPSTIRCIKTLPVVVPAAFGTHGQGAPSTIRCIKTDVDVDVQRLLLLVREHPAPSGALRRLVLAPTNLGPLFVREHPAPSGALRQRRIIMWLD